METTFQSGKKNQKKMNGILDVTRPFFFAFGEPAGFTRTGRGMQKKRDPLANSRRFSENR